VDEVDALSLRPPSEPKDPSEPPEKLSQPPEARDKEGEDDNLNRRMSDASAEPRRRGLVVEEEEERVGVSEGSLTGFTGDGQWEGRRRGPRRLVTGLGGMRVCQPLIYMFIAAKNRLGIYGALARLRSRVEVGGVELHSEFCELSEPCNSRVHAERVDVG